jgi:hypothetical protein
MKLIQFYLLKHLIYFYYKFSIPKTTGKSDRAANDARLLLSLPKKNLVKGFLVLTKSKAQLR